MRIRRILLNNAGPFLGDWEVELPDGLTAVVAEYEDSPESSNRAGKSFLAVDAPRYALFGEFRGRSDEFVHRVARGQEEGFVEVEVVSSAGKSFTIRRGRTVGNDPIRELDGVPIKQADLERAVVREVLGLSEREYLLTNLFVQGQMHGFMQLTPAQKREVVSPWFRTDRWVPRARLAAERLRVAQRALREVEIRRESLEDEVAELERGLDGVDLEANATKLAEARARLDRALTTKADLLAKLERAAEERREDSRRARELREAERERDAERRTLLEARDEAKSAVSLEKVALSAAVSNLGWVESLEADVARIDGEAEAVAEMTIDLKAREARKAELERKVRRLARRYADLAENRTGVCPVLNEGCDRIAFDPEAVRKVETARKRAKFNLERISREVEDLDWKLNNARSDLAMLREKVGDLRRARALPSVDECQRAYDRAVVAAEKAEAEFSRAKLGKTPAAKAYARLARAARRDAPPADESLERGIAAAVETVAAFEDEVAELERERAENESRSNLLDGHRRWIKKEYSKLRADARTEVENLAWAAYAFGSAGIPSRELENAFGVAEDEMNGVLADLGAPTRLRFRPSRELKDWEPACLGCGFVYPKGTRRHVCPECGVDRRKRRRDELRFDVLDGDAESSFDLDSGGGQILLSLGARLGLATLPGASRAVRCESVVIDEPDGMLDPPNRTALHQLLRNRLPHVGIAQTLLITHADVREEFESVVVVHRWGAEDRSGAWNA